MSDDENDKIIVYIFSIIAWVEMLNMRTRVILGQSPKYRKEVML
jgi:hypothetical protein